MTQNDDQRLVDYLFDELSEEDVDAYEQGLDADADLSEEVSGLADTLATMRGLEAEEPPAYLSAKVLAEARQVADEAAAKRPWMRIRKALWGPAGGLIGATAALCALVVVTVPSVMLRGSADEAPMVARSASQVPEAAPAEAPADAILGESEARSEAEPAAKAAAAPKGAKLAEGAPAEDMFELDRSDAPADEAPRTSLAKARAKAKPAADAPAPQRRRRARTAKRDDRAYTKDAPGGDFGIGDLGTSGGLAQGARSGGSAGAVASAPPPPPPIQPPAPRPRTPAPEPEPAAPTLDFSDDVVEERPAAPARELLAAEKQVEKKKRQEVSERAAPEDPAARAERIATDFIAAAAAEQARENYVAARKTLDRAGERTRGFPAQGRVFLTRARMEVQLGQLAEARRYALAASRVPGFRDRAAALALLRRIEAMQAPAAPAKPASEPPR